MYTSSYLSHVYRHRRQTEDNCVSMEHLACGYVNFSADKGNEITNVDRFRNFLLLKHAKNKDVFLINGQVQLMAQTISFNYDYKD